MAKTCWGSHVKISLDWEIVCLEWNMFHVDGSPSSLPTFHEMRNEVKHFHSQVHSRVTFWYLILLIGNFSFMGWLLPLVTKLNWNLLLVVLTWRCLTHFELRHGFYKSQTFKIHKNIQIKLCDSLLLLFISEHLFTEKKSKALLHDNSLVALEILKYFTLDRWSKFSTHKNSCAFYFPYHKKFLQCTASLVCFLFSQTWVNGELKHKPPQNNSFSI